MKKRFGRGMYWAVAALLGISLMLAGCGGKAKEPPTEPVPTVESSQAEPTAEAAQAQPTAGSSEAASAGEGGSQEITNALDNLLKLAPVHLKSSFNVKKGDQVSSQGRFEGDLDAKGNQHIVLYDENDNTTELYLVGGKMYIKSDGDQYMAIGDVPQDSAFSFLAIYGGAYLLAFNDMQDAKKVGRETVNEFPADKYEFKYNLASLGLAGAVEGAQGAAFDYKGYGWIEPQSQALVRSQVDWTSKGASEQEAEAYHSEFEASRGTFGEIRAPANVLDLSAMLTPTPE